MLAASRAIGLTKTFEHVRKELRINTRAIVGDTQTDTAITDIEEFNVDGSTMRRKLDRVHQQIPNDLLQALRIAFRQSR